MYWLARPAIEFRPTRDSTPVSSKRFSRDDSMKLVDLRNQAIGQLENHEFAKADDALTQILYLLPDDPFAPRNLAICRQLALDKIDSRQNPEEFTQATDLARQSVVKAKAAEPKSFIPSIIAARVAMKLNQSDEALVDLRDAMRLGPDSVGPAYDLFVLLQSSPEDDKNDESLKALRHVYQKEPNNLFVIKDLLPMLVERRSPEYIDVLKQVKETIEPFVETIKINTRVDLRPVFDKAVTAATEGKWPIAQQSTTTFRNIILSEAA